MDPSVQDISLATLVWQLAKTRDIHKLMAALEAKYGAINFRIRVPITGKQIHIFQDRGHVTAVLRKQTKLPFVNKNFDISHGHHHSINAVNTDEELWHDLHHGLDRIFRGKRIAPLMRPHHGIITQEDYPLKEALEDYFLRVWSEYCFGPVDVAQFAALRQHLVDTLGKVFHGNRVNRLPWVGRWGSIFYNWWYQKDLQEVDQGLAELLASAIANKQGMFYELYEQLRPKYPNAFQITLHNAFLGILVYDFIYIVMLDAMANFAKHPEVNRFRQVQQSMSNGFLFPYRFRTAEEDFGDVRVGDYCIINLKRAGLLFSSGARYCPGSKVFTELYKEMLSALEPFDMELTNPEKDIVYDSLDIPLMQNNPHVRLTRKVRG